MKKREWDRDRIFRKYIVAACAGLLIGLVMLGLIEPSESKVSSTALPLNSASSGHLPRGTLPWYVYSGQWRADVQTLAAVLRYLTDADRVAQTNGVALRG